MGGPLTIVEVPPFDRQAAACMTEEELDAFKYFIALNPESGDLIQGTGGLRKVRWAVGGRGKRGGLRIIYYYHSDEIPLFLLSAYQKARKGDLTASEKSELKKLVRQILDVYQGDKR